MTGAGQHGVATATACALLNLPCVVYMGAEDVKRQVNFGGVPHRFSLSHLFSFSTSKIFILKNFVFIFHSLFHLCLLYFFPFFFFLDHLSKKKALNVFRMKMLGAEVVPVHSGSQTLKDGRLFSNIFFFHSIACVLIPMLYFASFSFASECFPIDKFRSSLFFLAVNEALRDWVTNVGDTHYIIGSAIGPHPFPTIVRDLQSVIGRESRLQVTY